MKAPAPWHTPEARKRQRRTRKFRRMMRPHAGLYEDLPVRGDAFHVACWRVILSLHARTF